jgi:hypothetical protein
MCGLKYADLERTTSSMRLRPEYRLMHEQAFAVLMLDQTKLDAEGQLIWSPRYE